MTARIKTGSHIVSSSAFSFFGLVKPGTTFWVVGGWWGEVGKVGGTCRASHLEMSLSASQRQLQRCSLLPSRPTAL